MGLTLVENRILDPTSIVHRILLPSCILLSFFLYIPQPRFVRDDDIHWLALAHIMDAKCSSLRIYGVFHLPRCTLINTCDITLLLLGLYDD